MTTPRQLLAMGLLAALCTGAGPAALPTPKRGDLTLEFHGLPECPGEASLREWTADMFDFHDPFVRAGAPASLRIRVTLSHPADHYRGDFEIVGDDGQVLARTAEIDKNCKALVLVLAHRLRLAIPSATMTEEIAGRLRALEDGQARLEAESRAARQTIATLQQQNQALTATIERLRRREMDLTYALSAGALMTANLTSDVGPGLWLGGDLRVGPLVVGLELRSVLPARVAVGPHDLDLSQFVGLLTPCGRYSIVFGCAVAGAGLQIDHDSNFVTSNPTGNMTGYAPVVQLGGRLGVEVPLAESQFAVRGWGEVLYSTPSYFYSYSVNGTPTVTVDRPDVSAFFGLGVVYMLGK